MVIATHRPGGYGKKMKNMLTKINFFSDSYQFKSVTTFGNANLHFVEMELEISQRWDRTGERKWATINIEGKEVARYELKHGIGLVEIQF